MKNLRKIIRRVGSSVEQLVFLDDGKEKTCIRRNVEPISLTCQEANPVNCLYYKFSTGECGYHIPKEEYSKIPIELISALRGIRK